MALVKASYAAKCDSITHPLTILRRTLACWPSYTAVFASGARWRLVTGARYVPVRRRIDTLNLKHDSTALSASGAKRTSSNQSCDDAAAGEAWVAQHALD